MTAPAGWEQLPPAGSWERDTTTLPVLTDELMAQLAQQPAAEQPPAEQPPPAPPAAPAPAPTTTTRKARRMAEQQQDPQQQDPQQDPQSAGFVPGQLVTFRHPDPITGADITGAGVVVQVGEGDGAAVTVAPIAVSYLEVEPGNLTAAGIGPAES